VSNSKIFSKCGMRCDLCLIYRPNVTEKDRRVEICNVWKKIWNGFEPNPKEIICDGCSCGDEGILSSPQCETRKCVLNKEIIHCGYCEKYPCRIFPAEPTEEETFRNIEIEKKWTWEDEKLMEAYACKRNMDIFRKKMFEKIYTEEDLFPREITNYENRDYGVLFYNEENKDSYDSNHALIYRKKITDLDFVLKDIIDFYSNKKIDPIIYQSISDDGFFEEIKTKLDSFGFETWTEEQKFMILSDKNNISPNPQITVKKLNKWKDEFGTEIFEKSGEPWEIDVVKKALQNKNTLFFIAFYNENPVGMSYAHVADDVCRVDYLLVSAEYRKMGIGRTLINAFVEYCKENKILLCYLWPDGKSAEKIYYEAGFRNFVTKLAGRAKYMQ